MLMSAQFIWRDLGHSSARRGNVDAQQVFLNTFENIVNRRIDIPEDIQRFQITLQYVRSNVAYVISEFIYMLPSNMNLWIGKVKNYNNKIPISSPSFNPSFTKGPNKGSSLITFEQNNLET